MSEIVGVEAARAVLEAMLPGIRASLEAARGLPADQRRNAIGQIQARLRDFANSTRAARLSDAKEVAQIAEIDQIARDLHSRISADQIETSLTELESGAARLAALAARLGNLTSDNRAAAKSISLDPVKKAVDTMTAMVDSVKALKSGLKADDPDEARVAAEIQKLVDQFQTLRAAISSA